MFNKNLKGNPKRVDKNYGGLKMDTQVNCRNEYDKLQRVLVCQPEHMAIEEVINEVQKKYQNDSIDVGVAMKQHRQFEEALKEHGVEVIKLPSSKNFPEQVFTRDIGFSVGDDIFVAEMASEIRQGEEQALEEWLDNEEIPFHTTYERVEGGDIIVDQDTLYVGISSRTSEEAVQRLTKELPHFTIVPVPFDEKYLHLDCVFNIISPEIGLIFSQAFDAETVEMLSAKYTLIEVSEEEQFTMGTNVLSIGDKKLFSLPENKNVNSQMIAHGFEVIEVDFSEIIKSGGSFRCCSMPVVRE